MKNLISISFRAYNHTGILTRIPTRVDGPLRHYEKSNVVQEFTVKKIVNSQNCLVNMNNHILSVVFFKLNCQLPKLFKQYETAHFRQYFLSD
jgi:hypothetical protein